MFCYSVVSLCVVYFIYSKMEAIDICNEYFHFWIMQQ
jgi:uncharacterized membrane protein